jgi:hypothetical protein
MDSFIALQSAEIPAGFYKPLRAEIGSIIDVSANLADTAAGV